MKPAAGVNSPLLFGFLPRLHHEDLRQAIASHVAAQETLDAHGPAIGPEAIEARKAVETHLEVARQRIQGLLGHCHRRRQRSFSVVETRQMALNWPTRFRIRQTAHWCGCSHSSPKPITRTGARWSAALARAMWAHSRRSVIPARLLSIPCAVGYSISLELAGRARTSANISSQRHLCWLRRK